MKNFFTRLLSQDTPESSKRFAAIISLFTIIFVTLVATFKDENWVTPEFMFDALALIVGGGLGLTVVEKIFTKKTPDSSNKPPIE
jgi:lipoprotein signal peptidase